MKNRKLTEADVTSESVFMLQRRQILKMLGISATALTLSPAAHADLQRASRRAGCCSSCGASAGCEERTDA